MTAAGSNPENEQDTASTSAATSAASSAPPSTDPSPSGTSSDAASDPVYGPPPPTIDQSAESLLLAPDLMGRFLDDLHTDGLVGEDKNAQIILLVGISRLLPSPLNLSVKSDSSAGKTDLVERVSGRFPPGDVLLVDSLTPKALAYLPASIDGKLIIIAEYVGAREAEYFLRLVMSQHRLTTWTTTKAPRPDYAGQPAKAYETQKYEISARAAVVTTTTRARLHPENETRLIEITIDQSEEQTRRIVLAALAAGKGIKLPTEVEDAERRSKVWRAALGALQPFPVIVPDASLAAEHISCKRVRARRDVAKLLGLVRAHALLHQRQREVVDGHLVATTADVEAAIALADTFLQDVPPLLAAVLKRLDSRFSPAAFTARQAADELGIDVDSARRHLRALHDRELVEKTTRHQGPIAGRWRVVHHAPGSGAGGKPPGHQGGAS